MYRKYLLAADAVGDAAHGDGLVDAAVLLGDDRALESLGTLAVAFLDADEHANGVADVHLGQLRLHVLVTENFDQIHNNPILSHIDVHVGGHAYRAAQRTAFLTPATFTGFDRIPQG